MVPPPIVVVGDAFAVVSPVPNWPCRFLPQTQRVPSFLIAAPIAGYFMNQWLQGFAYRIELAWWIFAVAGMSTAAIALITISIHAVRAAVANPVNSLKAE